MEANEMKYAEVVAAGKGFIEMVCGNGAVKRITAGKPSQLQLEVSGF